MVSTVSFVLYQPNNTGCTFDIGQVLVLSMQALFPSRALLSATRIPCFGRQFLQRQRYMSTLRPTGNEPLAPGTIIKTDSGKTYTIDDILADRRKPLLCVYRAW